MNALDEGSAASVLNDLVFDKPEDAWLLTLAVVERAVDGQDLAFVAAGPIEDLIRHYPRTFAGRVVSQAHADLRFSEALNYVWGWDELPGDVAQELLPLLDREVRAYWEAKRAAGTTPQTETPQRQRRWRPPQPRPGSERFR